jgi:hypothetical protein
MLFGAQVRRQGRSPPVEADPANALGDASLLLPIGASAVAAVVSFACLTRFSNDRPLPIVQSRSMSCCIMFSGYPKDNRQIGFVDFGGGFKGRVVGLFP